MESPHTKLLNLQARLTNFFSYFKDDSVLVISEDKASLPFCYALIDDSHPRHILLSVAVDYPTSINVAEIALLSAKVGTTAITHSFYISTLSGKTYLDEEAHDQWELDGIDMEAIVPYSSAIN